MGDIPSKLGPVEPSKVLKQNKPPKEPNMVRISLPQLKVNFNYMEPLNSEIEETPDDEIIYFNEPQVIDSKREAIMPSSESCFWMEDVQEIKVKWNSFAKMKQRNYLTDYQVIKKIGRGGFGVVSKVKSIHTQVIRAAKVIKKKELKQNDYKKLLQEITIMRSLDHPNIIKIYEVYDYQDEYTLILEMMSGGELYKKVKGKKVPEKLARIYMRQIIRTLIYLHSHRIVHRDLKPENMLFENDGSGVLKIIDFGIAARIQPEEFLTDRIGTPYFIAPEVIYKKYNQKCDIWSAGIIFYMMLTGFVPFKADNEVHLMQNILREEPKMTGSNWDKFSPECKQLLALMLQKKPQKRPSAAQIYNHPWFSIDNHEMELASDQKGEQILRNIRKFNFTNKLQAVVHTFIASQLLSSEQKSILVEIFKELDLNNDGVISTQELKDALQKKKDITLERVEFLVSIIDTNCSGEIDYTEFLVAGLSSEDFMKREHFEKAFAYFDIDHSGSITYEEVVEFLENYEKSEEEIEKMFKEVDSNGDGEIDQEEFITLFINHTSHFKLLHQTNHSFKSIKEMGPTLKEKRKVLLEQNNLNSLKIDDIKEVFVQGNKEIFSKS